MKKILPILSSLLFAFNCSAQIGIVGGYKTYNAPGFNESLRNVLNEEPYPTNGWQVGVDYWFRLKKRRIEFTPELSFSRYNHTYSTNEMDLKQIGLHFNTSVYVFDLASDCNCPTFSKDGNILGKGFFVELSPGLVYLNNEIKGEFVAPPSYEKEAWAVGGSLGLGLDIGLTDMFTITPIARLHYYPKTHSLADLEPAEKPVSEIKQVFVGVKFRLHFREIAKARYR